MTDLALLREAARLRGEQMRQVADRPRERRSEQAEGVGLGVIRSPLGALEVRSAGTGTGFHGLASRTDTPYDMYDAFGPYVETVVRGAFAKTLAQDGLDVPLVLGHERDQVFARTTSTDHPLSLAETGDGLEADAPTPDWSGFDWLPGKIRTGLIDEMSFRFRITRGQWSPDFLEYHIEEVDLHRGDVAIVGYGANPNTSAVMRSAKPELVSFEGRTNTFVVEEYRRIRAELRSRGIKPPMSFEDIPA